MKHKIAMLSLITLLLALPNFGTSGVDMVILSGVTWGTTNSTLGGGGAKDSYFNSLKADMYYHLGWLKGYVGFPVTLTLEYPKDSDDIRYAFFPIDLTLYVGKSLGVVEPRIGMDIPFGYPTTKEGAHAWTGSRNYNLLLGLGFSGGEYFNKRLSIGGELMGRVFLNSMEQSALIESGSFKTYLAAKASVKINKSWSTGFEIFTEYKYYRDTDWTKDYSDPTFTGIGILPILFAGFQPTPKTEIALKGGVGKEIVTDEKGKNNSLIIFGVLGFNFYLW